MNDFFTLVSFQLVRMIMIYAQEVITIGNKTCLISIKKIGLLFYCIKNKQKLAKLMSRGEMFKKLVCVIGVISLLSACQPSDKLVQNLPTPICIDSQSHCEVNTPLGRFIITFNQASPQAETPFELHVEYQGNYRVVNLSGYLEGIDMFMGKIPLFFNENIKMESENSHFIAQAMFGACSLDQMKWQIIVIADIEHNESTEQQIVSLSFISSRS